MIKRYWWLLTIALVVGFLHIAPYVYFEQALGDEYKGVFMAGTYDEDIYLSLINQADGQKFICQSLYLREPR